MSLTSHEHNETTIIPNDRAGQGETIFAAASARRRLMTSWRGNLFMLFTIGAGAFVLSRFTSHVSRLDQMLTPTGRPGAGMVVCSEVLCIWLPSALVELAKRQSQSRAFRSHDELSQFLILRDQEDLLRKLHNFLG
jgi:hypothetical protein